MRRDVTSALSLAASGPARLVLSVAVADKERAEEALVVTQDGRELEVNELRDARGTRLHTCDVKKGSVDVSYRATVRGQSEPAPVTDMDLIEYLRPSRYCESDTLTPTAVAEAGGRSGLDLVSHIGSWVGTELAYISGSSRPTDGAAETYMTRRGVCRDFAHLVVAMLRAMDVPARLVSVYAPGLSPMDFHAVAEALVDGEWWAVDATTLAPRQSMVRIATGRDAADTAFLTTIGEPLNLESMEVTATVDSLPSDDVREFVRLS
ncbi:transglutaminase-like domain-containing protein [Demequina sp. SO4-13]|uniref:transglutaminase-like domain-containing protein n=1 Tax=Demequina sp. SO4-13 TaxID=3401027 RepID=UPI003AF86275